MRKEFKMNQEDLQVGVEESEEGCREFVLSVRRADGGVLSGGGGLADGRDDAGRRLVQDGLRLLHPTRRNVADWPLVGAARRQVPPD